MQHIAPQAIVNELLPAGQCVADRRKKPKSRANKLKTQVVNSDLKNKKYQLFDIAHEFITQYEKGKTRISLDQYEKLLQAANPYQQRILRVVRHHL